MILFNLIQEGLLESGLPPLSEDTDVNDLSNFSQANRLKSLLLLYSRQLQNKAYNFNYEPNYTGIPDSNGHITLPKNVIGIYDNASYTLRGGRLFDLDNETYIFNSAVSFGVVFERPLEELPETALQAIKYKALLSFIGTFSSTTELNENIRNLGVASMNTFLDEYYRKETYNLLSGRRALNRTEVPQGNS